MKPTYQKSMSQDNRLPKPRTLWQGARRTTFLTVLLAAALVPQCLAGAQPSASSAPAVEGAPGLPGLEALGIAFVDGSTSSLIVERNGKKYLVDLASRQVKEIEATPSPAAPSEPAPQAPATQAQELTPGQGKQQTKPEVYQPGDDNLFSLPTGRRLDRHGFYVNFTHRFAYDTAFTGPSRGHYLLGLDGFSISSFGFRYGVTNKFSVSAYRSPSALGRPIQLMAAYNLWDERDHNPLNVAARVSVEGQNDFSKNFTVNFEGILSRSLTSHAQVYVVPTVSLQNRELMGPPDSLTNPPLDLPGFNTFALGVGGALDIRPTVALVAEVIPTLVNGRPLGIHRPAYSFGIQKKIWRHAFTFGFSNSPGTTVSQRGATRATLLGDPSADTPSGMFVGFDLTRQIY